MKLFWKNNGHCFIPRRTKDKRWLTFISSLGRYVFGSEISYNKAPPPPAWARLLNKPKSQKIVGH